MASGPHRLLPAGHGAVTWMTPDGWFPYSPGQIPELAWLIAR